jgi:hypothetical protein
MPSDDHVRSLGKFMTIAPYRYQSDFARRHFSQGEAKGMAEGMAEGMATAVLMIFDVRGVAVPDKVRTEIAACTDLERLDEWIRRAVNADSIGDVLG